MASKNFYIYSNLNHAISADLDCDRTIFDGFEGKLHPYSDYLFSHLQSLNPEIFEVNISDIEELGKIVKNEYEKHQVLNMFLELIDTKLDRDYKFQLSNILEEEIKTNFELLVFVENRLTSSILPSSFSIKDSISLISHEAHWVLTVLKKLLFRTPLFAGIFTLFRLNIPIHKDLWSTIYKKLTDLGIFYQLVIAFENRSLTQYWNIAFKCLQILKSHDILVNESVFTSIIEGMQTKYAVNLISDSTKRISNIPYRLNSKKLFYIDYSIHNQYKNYELIFHIIDCVNFYKDGQNYEIINLLQDKTLNLFNHEYLYIEKAIIHYYINDFEASAKYCNSAYECNRENRDERIFHLFGLLYYRKHQFQQAFNCFDTLIKSGFKHAIFYNNRGACYNLLHFYTHAIDDFTHAILLNKKETNAYFNLGNSMANMGKFENAIAYYNISLTFSPNNSKFLHNKGRAYFQLNQFEKAFENLLEAIKFSGGEREFYEEQLELLQAEVAKSQSSSSRSLAQRTST
jgi:tetratricopeptide (TPR) repeat protein